MLRIGIVGAGIAGLACAIFLRHLGFAVTVYERSAVISEAGAGIQIPPNASALFAKIPGLLSKLRAAAFEPKQIVLRRYDNSEVLQTLPGAPIIEASIGSPYLVVHRARYQRILCEAAIEIGAEVLFDTQIAHLDQAIPALTSDKFGTRAFDLVIGADGVNSFCRGCIASSPTEITPSVSASRAYRAILPTEAVKATLFGRRLVESQSVFNWLGPKRHVVAYPISDEHLNLVLVHPGPAEIDSWDQMGSVEEMKKAYSDFDPELQLILNLSTSIRAWKILETPELLRWGTVDGKVILIGDAAHAMVPYMAQGAAQAVEDAAVLARCLYTMEPFIGLAGVLSNFEKLRRPRVAKIVEGSRKNGQTWELEDGPEQQQRDQDWRAEAQSRRQMQGKVEDTMQGGTLQKHNGSTNFDTVIQTMPRTRTAGNNFRKWLWGSDLLAEVDEHARSLSIAIKQQR